MELKDVNLVVEDPNKDYFVGLSSYSMGFGFENFYTDGFVRLVDEEPTYGLHGSIIRVEDATYVARAKHFDMYKRDINEMNNHSFSIISADPAEVIEKEGLDKIFNSNYGYPSHLSTATVYSKKTPDKSMKTDDFMKLY